MKITHIYGISAKNSRNPPSINSVLIKKFLHVSIEGNPFEKGVLPQTSFLKLSVLIFAHYRAHLKEMRNPYFTGVRPIMGKNSIKSLWKGVRGRTFPQKGFPR